MDSLQTEEKAIVDSEAEALPPLRRRLLRFVRVAWVVLVLMALGVFIISIPVHFRQHVGTVSRDEHPTLAMVAVLLAAHTVAINTITVLVFSLAAAAIFWRSPRDRMAILVSTAMLTIGVAVAPTLDTLLGVVLYVLLRSIPVLGWLIGLLVTFVGLGAMWLLLREARSATEPTLGQEAGID
jgi:hypothetical protein